MVTCTHTHAHVHAKQQHTQARRHVVNGQKVRLDSQLVAQGWGKGKKKRALSKGWRWERGEWRAKSKRQKVIDISVREQMRICNGREL